MVINTVEHLDRHAEKPRSFPFVDACLHQSGRGGVAQCASGYATVESGLCDSAVERGLHRQSDWLAILFHDKIAHDALVAPATQTGE